MKKKVLMVIVIILTILNILLFRDYYLKRNKIHREYNSYLSKII